MRKLIAVLLAILFMFTTLGAMAQSTTTDGNPPAMPSGQTPGGTGGAPGGQSAQPDSYSAVTTLTADDTQDGVTVDSTGTDENAVLVTGGTLTLTNATITRTSNDSAGGDSASFYGVGAAVLATEGTAVISNSTVSTNAAGGAGVFAYGDGVVYVSDSTIQTAQDTSGGIHVAGGGTLYAKNLTVQTQGGSSAAIRSDRGGGTMVVDGGSYVSSGSGSPAIYCTADITVNNATLTANGAEALCLEGLNTVRLFDATLTGNMPDLSQNDNTWTVILYQSMSGDAEVGEGRFEMSGGTLNSQNGGLFYTTNTESEFVLSGVTIQAAGDSEYFLRCTGNANQRGWGESGANGAVCTFTGLGQQMNGNVIWDSISTLNLYALTGSVLTGAVLDDESCAGTGGNGTCTLTVDADSTWVVTGNSVLTTLHNAGSVVDESGNAVTVLGTDGTVYAQGSSEYTVTVTAYDTMADTAGAGTLSNWSDAAVSF